MNKIFNNALLLLGGNMPNSKKAIFDAEEILIRSGCEIILSSSLYGSEAWGFHSENFINQIFQVKTELSAIKLLELCLDTELKLGRIRTEKSGYSSRIIDIDILFYNNEIYTDDKLSVPHPRLHLRRFTLMPLDEKWPNYIHPIFNKTMSQLLLECEDEGKVWKIAP